MQPNEQNMGEFPSGQRGQTVNLLRIASMVRIRPPPPQRCVTVDTNGYAPLFFPIEIALQINEFWQQGVQSEPLVARTFLLSGENHIFL